MIDFLTPLEHAAAIKDFIEGDRLPILLAELGQQAAKDTLSQIHLANDPRAVVQSAVTQLKLAETALRTHTENNWRRLAILNIFDYMNRLHQRRMILLLMAACYCYLQEDRLMESTLQTALSANVDPWPRGDDPSPATLATGVATMLSFLNPLSYRAMLAEAAWWRYPNAYYASAAQRIRALRQANADRPWLPADSP